MNEQQFLLANAYLDGELTDEERASAEADPTVMAGVEELRALQARVREVEPPSAAARDAAIAAAVAELRPAGAAAAPAAAGSASRVVPFRPRPASARWLAFAAAAVGVGALGVVVVNGIGSGDDDAAKEAPAAAEPAADEPASDESTRIAEEGTAVAELATEADTAATDAGAAEPLAEDAAAEPAAEPAQPTTGVRPVIDPDAPVSTPEELGSYGTYLVELLAAGELPPTPNTSCATDTSPGVIGRTQYLVDGQPTEVLVEVDDVVGRVVAIDPDTCAPLVVGPLYR
jgi:hypothetical protein